MTLKPSQLVKRGSQLRDTAGMHTCYFWVVALRASPIMLTQEYVMK